MIKTTVKINSPQRKDQISTRYNSMSAEHRLSVLLNKDLEFEARDDTDIPTNQTSKSCTMNACEFEAM
jgi:hypothetical protein